ncbi:hypothetical protein WMW72_19435 [Paenibacillus filicis]|uniref:Uncharacterized protein n=1 Tax=Paenibacillus filicis TaxID=669464 RepID=A0ABU9DPC1_9BACL
MVRNVLQSLVCAAVLLLMIVAAKLAWGLYLTARYVPDIIQTYSSADHLQSKTSIGFIVSRWSMGWMVLAILAAMAVFIVGKLWWTKRKRTA